MPLALNQNKDNALPSDSKDSAPKPAKPRAPLRRPNVVVRVRPFAESGGHSDQREAVYKRLASWEDGVVVIEDNVGTDNGSLTGTRSESFTFGRDVLGPSAKQIEMYDVVAAKLMTSVCSEGFSGFIFAYGQTGTGKTHTIFGPEASWRSIRHEESGILPRAVAAILDTVRARAETTSFVLTASAVEFYMCQCTDLLDGGAACIIGADHKPLGLVNMPIESEAQCVDFMSRVRAQRHTRATYMNAATDGHEGSSRSHAAMVLTLRQLNKQTGSVLTTELHIMDMAGAERPKSLTPQNVAHQCAALAILEHERGMDVTIGDQGAIINYELSQLRTAVVQASEQHEKGLPLLNAKALNTAFVEYAKGCFDGSALLSMIVTLSPARGCGWETWFSCTYGVDLQKLRCPVRAQKAKDLAKLIAATEKTVEKMADELAHAEVIGAVNKYVTKRIVMARHEARTLEQLRRLQAGGAPTTAAGESGLGSWAASRQGHAGDGTDGGPACVIS
jgi:hypothetical protein